MLTIMQTNLLKKIVIDVLYTLLFLLFLFMIYVIWERNRDTLQAINLVDTVDACVVYEKTILDSSLAGKRYYTNITLLSQKTDTIKAIISFPVQHDMPHLPVVTILGGLRIERQDFNFFKDPGQNIIIMYLYPYQADQWEKGFILSEISRVRRAILKTPGQIAELLRWTQKQGWADSNRVALLGYSFGALFLPAAVQLAGMNNINTGPLILSYGGVDIELLLDENLKVKPLWLRSFLAWFGSSMIYAVDPLHYASNLTGDIYVINGLRDKQIPKTSWQRLHQMMPASAKIDILNEGHMHPRKPELTQKLVDMSRRWLEEQGILNF